VNGGAAAAEATGGLNHSVEADRDAALARVAELEAQLSGGAAPRGSALPGAAAVATVRSASGALRGSAMAGAAVASAPPRGGLPAPTWGK
jgi:hypothetical protein